MCVYLAMRKRINITLDETLYKSLKKRAGKEKATISGIIEIALKKTELRKNDSDFLAMIDNLPLPRISVAGDLKKTYFENKS